MRDIPFSKPELPRNATITPIVTRYLPGRKNKMHIGKKRARRHLADNMNKKALLDIHVLSQGSIFTVVQNNMKSQQLDKLVYFDSI